MTRSQSSPEFITPMFPRRVFSPPNQIPSSPIYAVVNLGPRLNPRASLAWSPSHTWPDFTTSHHHELDKLVSHLLRTVLIYHSVMPNATLLGDAN